MTLRNCLLGAILLGCALFGEQLAVVALSERQWKAIPIGQFPWRQRLGQDGGAGNNASAPTSSMDFLRHRRLEDKDLLMTSISAITRVFGKLQTMSLSDIAAACTSLDFGSVQAGTRVVASPGQATTVKEALEANNEAIKKVVDNLSLLQEDFRDKITQASAIEPLRVVFNQWKSFSHHLPSDIVSFTSGCRGFSDIATSNLGKLSSKDVSTVSSKDFPLVVARGMLVVVAMTQYCAGARGSEANARTDLGYVAVFLERAKVKGSEGLQDKLTASSGESAGSATSNTAYQDAINNAFDSNDDFFAAIDEVTGSDVWRIAMDGDADAAELAKLQAMAIAKSHQQITKSLTTLDNTVQETHDERMGKIGSINANIDGWHAQKMTKIDTMKTVFTEQHNVRMGKLVQIDSTVTAINSKAQQGFQGVQSKLYDIQDKLVDKIAQIGDLVTQDKEQTIAYLSDELRKSAQATYAQINQIDNQVTAGGQQILNALSRTKSLAEQEFAATGNTLVQASEVTGEVLSDTFKRLQVTATTGFSQVLDLVSTKIANTANAISADLAVVDRQLDFVDNRLVVLENAVASVQNKLEITNLMLQSFDAAVEDVVNELRKFSSTVKQILMENDVADLQKRFIGLRTAYQYYVENEPSSSTEKRMSDACNSQKAYDLFLSYLHLIDIEDSRLPRQMDAFGHDAAKYERFGQIIIAALKNLSMLSNVCTGIAFVGITQEDLELKVKEHNALIRHAAGQFTRHIQEVLPAYMIRYYVNKELQAWSTQQWGDRATQLKKADALRSQLQASIGEFACITVFYAGGADSSNLIQLVHLDEQGTNATDIANVRRRGAMVSTNRRLAVLWSATKQLPDDQHTAIDNELLLKQGIFRGTVSTPNSAAECVVSQNSTFYPRCYANCTCVHYEDFASETSASAGRALTVFNSTAFESDFTISSTFDPYVDYFMEDILVEAKGLGTSAFGEVRAPTLSKTRVQKERTLWEGYTDTGNFNAAVSSIKGTLLYRNEMTLSMEYSATTDGAFRQTIQLFCNGHRQENVYQSPSIKISYTCREVVRNTLGDGSDAFVVSGSPTARLKNALCAESDESKLCRVVGDFAELPAGAVGLEIGANIRDLTLYAEPNQKGSFAICKGCTAKELEATGISFGSISLETPQASLLPYLDLTCEKKSATIMVCIQTTA